MSPNFEIGSMLVGAYKQHKYFGDLPEDVIGGFFHKLIYMLSTDQFDKNGVEIFEGDIIEWTAGKKTLRQVVHRRTEKAEFKPKSIIHGKCLVLGNIYQNPNLESSCLPS